MNTIYNNENIEIEYLEREKEFSVNVFDKYGHYIDNIKIPYEDMQMLYESLEKFF